LLLSVINVALSLLGIDANWQMLAYGVVILVAIITDRLGNRSSLETAK
jgi:ribose/xylose/arabinose/galactoside ABC-type transport system permease subunit